MERRTEEETQLTPSADASVDRAEEVPGLTILAHPDPRRVGERLALPALAAGQEVRLARLKPAFRAPGAMIAGEACPLADRSISRTPIRLVPSGGGAVTVHVGESRTVVAADGERIDARRLFPAADIERGVVLQLGRRVALVLHRMLLHAAGAGPSFGLVGESAGVARVRQEISRLADLELPVLLRGATGTGKELVARALHEAGRRRRHPFVAVNMAVVPPTLAAAELFGAVRGAYTGAAREKIGLFQHAGRGTLFLDEIGETPPEVQPMLLRALENREILPLGAVEPRKVDVRVVAATDSRLGEAISDGRFRAPLLHRLAGYSIRLPALAQRRDDIGRLLCFFLNQELEKVGEAPLRHDAEHPWPPAEVVARLGAHEWPGNVRQLRNVARWLVVAGRGLTGQELSARLGEVLDGSGVYPAYSAPPSPAADSPAGTFERRKLRKPSEISEEELLAALRTHRFKINTTAEALGVSRANLYRMIDDCPAVRKAAQLGREEIEEVLARCGGDLETAAVELEVSLRGLKRRMTALGLTHS